VIVCVRAFDTFSVKTTTTTTTTTVVLLALKEHTRFYGSHKAGKITATQKIVPIVLMFLIVFALICCIIFVILFFMIEK